jgi:hypothetical protein
MTPPFLGLIITKISLYNDTSKSFLNYQHLAITHYEIFAVNPQFRRRRWQGMALFLHNFAFLRFFPYRPLIGATREIVLNLIGNWFVRLLLGLGFIYHLIFYLSNYTFYLTTFISSHIDNISEESGRTLWILATISNISFYALTFPVLGMTSQVCYASD